MGPREPVTPAPGGGGARPERPLFRATPYEQRERFRKVFDEGPLGISVVDLNFRFLEVNDAFCRMLQYSPEELTARTFADITHPDDIETDVQLARRVFAGEIPFYEIEKRYLKKDGEVVHISLTRSVIRDEHGQITHSLAMVRDLTAAKAEAAANERLASALAERETLLREIHHRVKNNLQVVSSLLSLQIGHLADPELQALVQESQTRIGAMALVHETLYQADDLARVDLRAYLADVAEAVGQAHATPDRPVDVSIDVDPLPMDLDGAVRSGLIVNELVSNAYKHAFRGRPRGRIDVRLSAGPGRDVALVVADDGVGMPPDLVPQQVESLGLQLVHHLSSELGGGVTVTRDRGTRFCVSFPRSRDAEEQE